jgi:outer membrane protein TolC
MSAFFIFFGRAFAEETVSLNSLIGEALKNNPQIKAAQYRHEAARARVRLLRSLADPKIEYEYDKITADMDALMTGRTSPMRTFAVSQEVPFPTKLFFRRQSAQKEASSFEQEYKETERKVVKEVKEAFFQLFLSHKKIAVTKENLELLDGFIKIANAKYSVGKAKQQDVLRAQVEYSKLSNQLVLLQQEQKIAQAMLNALLDRPADQVLGTPEEKKDKDLEIEEAKILQLAKDNRPELKSFKEMVEKTKIDYSLAKQEYLPDLMFKYRREERNGQPGAWSGMVGMTLPLWFWEKQNSFVKEARANREEAQAEYKATQNMVLFETRSAYARFEAAKKLVKIYETGVLPQIQAALDTARLGYGADKIDFLELLDTMRSLREFELEYFESLANLEISLADLEQAVGVDLVH